MREEDIYPSISFCLSIDTPTGPWYEGGFPLYQNSKSFDTCTNRQEYVHFLLGNDSGQLDSRMSKQPAYDEVTIDLRKYVNVIIVESVNNVV